MDRENPAELAAGTREETDTTTMAATANVSDPMRGAFYRPIKHPLSLRLDADVIAWFQTQGQGYQTRINSALREYIDLHTKKPPVYGRRKGDAPPGGEGSDCR